MKKTTKEDLPANLSPREARKAVHMDPYKRINWQSEANKALEPLDGDEPNGNDNTNTKINNNNED